MKTKEMTHGNPFKLLLYFAIPLILGNVFQQCYTMVDTIIVGQGVGVSALASIGAGDWLTWMVVGLIQGFTQGFSIEVSQAFGEGNTKRVQQAVFHSLVISVIAIVVLSILSQLLARPALLLLDTPSDILDGTLIYLRTIYGGILFITIYNLMASILRGLGNSKTPLYAMVIASIVNIVLDLLFVFVFHWGIFGAAFATILSQGLSAVICIYSVVQSVKIEFHQPILKDHILRLLQLGVPMAFNVVVIAAGGLVVQAVVNGYGLLVVAAYTAANKMFGILESAGISFGYAISTFMAQNLGALKFERIHPGMKAGAILSIVVSVLISICMILFGRNILSLFIESTNPDFDEVIRIAYRYLSVMAYALPMLYFLHLYRNALQGFGKTSTTLISGVIELFMRVVAVLWLPRLVGLDGIFYAEILAWIGATVYLAITFYLYIPRLEKRYQISD